MNVSIFLRLFRETDFFLCLPLNFAREIGARPTRIDPLAHTRHLTAVNFLWHLTWCTSLANVLSSMRDRGSFIIWLTTPFGAKIKKKKLNFPMSKIPGAQETLILMSVRGFINHSHSHISIHLLHTVLHTFSKVLTRRTCLTIKRFFSY